MNTNQQQVENEKIPYNKVVSICLLALVISFAMLVPGGFIETRDFSHLDAKGFWGFNAFLIALSLVAIVMIFLTWQQKKPAFWVSITVAWLYIFVFILDWSHVFPTSPDPMSFWLCMIEILDSILCFYIVIFSHKSLNHF